MGYEEIAVWFMGLAKSLVTLKAFQDDRMPVCKTIEKQWPFKTKRNLLRSENETVR